MSKPVVFRKCGRAVEGCPFCACSEFYVPVKMSGVGRYHMKLDEDNGGGKADNSQLHEGLKYTLGVTARCAECNAIVGRFVQPIT